MPDPIMMPLPPGDSGPCRETAVARLTRICEERRKELEQCDLLLRFLNSRPDQLGGPADELLWNLLRECELHR